MKRRLLLLLLLLGSWLGLSTAQAQTTIARESFESTTTPANSTSSFGYTSFTANPFDVRVPNVTTIGYFLRSQLPVTGFNTANGFVFGTGIDGDWLWAGEDVRVNNAGNATRPAGFVQLNGISIAGKSSVQVLVSFADARGLGSGATIGQATNNWENNDFVRIKVRVDNAATWTTIGQLVGDNPAGGGGGRLRQDSNLNGISSDDLSAPAVASSFQDFTFNLTNSGSTLDVMVEVDAKDGSEELAFDNIRVLGTASATAAPVLAGIETTSLSYNEGAPATIITNTVTVSDADSPNLTGATVALSTGFVPAQDRLSLPTQSSITSTYNTTTGVLTLSGTASLAAYQTALRSVRYQNIETVTAIGGLRLATFTVTDGTATSAVSRDIIVNAQLNAPAALPYTEEFETDGEGLRYASNTWVASNCTGFLRVTANPYACTPTTFGGISGSGYWYAEGTVLGSNPNLVKLGTLVLAPVNATNIGSLHFNVKLGIGDGTPAGLQWEIDDYVKFFYRVNGGSWVQFGAFFGDGPTTATPGNLRRDANLDGVADPGGTILTTTLQNIDFALPTNVTGASVDFMIEVSSGGQEELAMDRIVVTGTPATTVNSLVRASTNPTNAATVTYTVTFGAPVTGLTASNFTLATSGLSVATVGTPVSTGTGSTWTVPVNTGTGSGTLTLNLVNDTNLSTDITNTLPFAGETYTIDKTAPTVSSVAVPTNGTYRTGQTLSFTVNFSEAVTVTGTPQLGLTLDTGGSVQANYASGSGTAALVFSYTIVAGNADANGITVGTLALNAGTLRDAATNNATLTLNGVPATTGVLVDGIVPTVTSINRQTPTAATTNATSLTYRVTFSEAVTGVTANDFSLTATGTATGTASAVAAVSTSVYDVTVSSASGDGTLRLDLNSTGTGIADLATNPIGGGYTSGQSYALDNAAPTATITTTATSPTSTSPILFTVTFSEAVTGFTASGITVANGTITTAITNVGNAYSFSVTPTANGAVTVSVLANAAQDAAGNGNAAAGPLSVTYTAPITATVWTGTISPDWFTAGNWTAGVPTTTIDATIPNGTVFSPTIGSGTATTRSLTLNSGTTLNMSGGTLDVRANLTNNGTLVPTGGTVVLGTTAISNGPNIFGSSRARFWNLTINANGVLLSTSAGASVRRLLTLNGAFVTQGNTFVLESDASGTAMVVNSNSAGFVFGSATVQRYIDASGNTGTSGYRHYASPVGGATVNSLSTSAYGGSFTAQVNTLYNTQDPNTLTLATYPNVFGYDESKLATSPAVSFSDFDKGYQSPASLSDQLTVGRGYTVQIGNTEKVQFTGPLNNNTQTINGLTYAAAGTAGAASAGWALVGNPYPAPLDWRTVGNVTGSSLNSVDGAAYVFQSTSAYAGRYTAFTNNVGAGTGLIAVGQGFFVRASTPGTTGSIVLTNSNRVTSYASPAFQRTTAETRPLLRLSLGLGNQPATVATAQDETFLYFEPGATNGIDGKYDAYKLANPSGYYLGSVAPGSSPVGLSIDGRSPLAAATTTEIPLWVSLPAGTYSLTATELLNFATLAGGTTVQLRDALLGTLTDLATVPSYSFSVAANAAYAGRFSLVFRTSGVLATLPGTELALAKASLYPNPATSATALSVTDLPKAVTSLQVEVVDVLGRVVGHYTLPVSSGSAHQSLATDQLASTLYLLRLTALDAQGQVQGTLPTQRLTIGH